MSDKQHESQSAQAQPREVRRGDRPRGQAAADAQTSGQAERVVLYEEPSAQRIHTNILTQPKAPKGKPMKEGKEGKEGKDGKEKPEKYESKEGKEKPEKYESKEGKEKPEKEGKEGKEWEGFKQKGEKETAEKPGVSEGPEGIAQPGLIYGQVRLSRRLHGQGGRLSHFIKPSLRPDLSRGALRRESDVHGGARHRKGE